MAASACAAKPTTGKFTLKELNFNPGETTHLMTSRTMQKASEIRKPTISSVRGAMKLHGSDLSSGKLFVPF